MRFARLFCGIALVAAIAACTDDKPVATPPSASTPASAPAWQEPANYAYVVDRRCGTGPSEGVYRVTVTGGAVAGIERIDGKTASGEEEVELPTLGGLLDLAQNAADDGGEMTTSADPADGHPVAISFDVSEGAGEPTCFTITEYAVRG
ncbi:DUF6174 domain-containing protein [Actinoplanes sp. NPDC026623]|uniref:DUF6174 domain-containing protein n=1 Tax=Actinoplanes sp. NPDC026623 TaxID=3155610 RepID=UPI0033D22386